MRISDWSSDVCSSDLRESPRETHMLNIVITGGAGFLGQKLAHELLQRGTLVGPDGKPQPIGRLSLFDTVAAPGPDTPRVTVVTGDIGDADTVQRLIGTDTHSVFHLAAIVSSGAEADFDGGYRVNLEGTKNVLAARSEEHTS